MIASPPFTPGAAARYRQGVDGWLIEELLRAQIEPAFRGAMAETDITAWVCDNDRTALMALDFRRRHTIAVPRRLSIMGFNNSMQAIGAGLTSFDFNIPALVHGLLHHLRTPEHSRHVYPEGMARIGGFLIERSSTRRNG